MYVYHVHHIGYYKLLSIVGITWQDAPVSQYAALLQDYKVTKKRNYWKRPFLDQSKRNIKQNRNTFLKNYVPLGEMCGSGKPTSKH